MKLESRYGKLHQTNTRGWILNTEDDTFFISSTGTNLSVENCESIKRGYDLNKLRTEAFKKHDRDDLSLNEQIGRAGGFLVGYEEGFKECLDIKSEYRYTLEDIMKAMDVTFNFATNQTTENYEAKIQLLKSLNEKTEWDVEILVDELVYPANMPEKGEERPPFQTKYDENGKLQLKIRKK